MKKYFIPQIAKQLWKQSWTFETFKVPDYICISEFGVVNRFDTLIIYVGLFFILLQDVCNLCQQMDYTFLKHESYL